MKWKEKTCVKLSKNMNGFAPTPDGRMAVGYGEGGIEIFSAEGELQQTVMEDVEIHAMVFLSDGRCVVRDIGYDISLYTPEWNHIDVRFDSLKGGSSLAVDCDDHIYVGYRTAKKIQVFTPIGWKGSQGDTM